MYVKRTVSNNFIKATVNPVISSTSSNSVASLGSGVTLFSCEIQYLSPVITISDK